MPYQIDDRVVHATYGVGRIARFVRQRFSGTETRPYYEIALAHSTAWVLMDVNTEGLLRPITARGDLARYQAILRGRPAGLTKDYRQRRQELIERLQQRSFQATCEVVRDLAGAAWLRTLAEVEATLFQANLEKVCQEWAGVKDVPLADARAEVTALLQEARAAYRS